MRRAYERSQQDELHTQKKGKLTLPPMDIQTIDIGNVDFVLIPSLILRHLNNSDRNSLLKIAWGEIKMILAKGESKEGDFHELAGKVINSLI